MAGSACPTLSRQADDKRIYHGRRDALCFPALRALPLTQSGISAGKSLRLQNTSLNRLGAHCASITIFSVNKMGCGAHPKRHRLEACATNVLLSKRGVCSPFFNRKQKNGLIEARHDN